ncbi:hypothetical protein [Methylocella sp.]|uniref:hypothetical protein n=1 Tax=Methylocella sp. TaxID=1978226 RepID=UPI0035B0D5D2
MTAVLFDTLRLSRTLRDKGHFSPEQAEALAEALGDATQDNLATKADIAALRAEIAGAKGDLGREIAGVKGELGNEIASLKGEIKGVKGEIAEAKADILKWVVGAIGFQTVVILGAIVSLIKIFAK